MKIERRITISESMPVGSLGQILNFLAGEMDDCQWMKQVACLLRFDKILIC